MKTKTNYKSTLTFTAVVLLVASSAQLSASDYRLWREQVPNNHTQSHTVGVIGGQEGSWFLKDIVMNHRNREQGQQVRDLNGVPTSSSSARTNWFIHAIAPSYDSSGSQNGEKDSMLSKIALSK